MYVRIRISILAQLRGYSQLDQSRHGYIYGTDRVPGEDANLCQLKSPRGATLPSAEKGKDKGNKWMAGGAEWLIVGNFFYRCFPEGGQPGHSAIDRVTYAYDRVAMYRTTGSQGPERPGRIHHRWDPVQAAASMHDDDVLLCSAMATTAWALRWKLLMTSILVLHLVQSQKPTSAGAYHIYDLNGMIIIL